jgi:tetratricopeptide (TPR) repeat protein
MNRYFAAAILFVLMGRAAPAAPVNLWLEKANAAYEQGAFDTAEVYYEKIIAAGANNSDVYYNLGNACFRLKKIGPAILAYEKAKALSPNDPDIIANLKFANLNTVDKMPQPERSFISAAAWRLHTLLSLEAQLWALVGMLCLLSALISWAFFASHNVRLWLIYGSALLGSVTALAGFSAGVKIWQAENNHYAIVLSPLVDAKSEPNGSKVLFSAHEGAKLRIVKDLDAWSFVSLPNGSAGWVENSALGRI